MPLWEQDFAAYIATIDEVPGSFLVDLAGVEHAPVPGYDRRVQVRVTLQSPRTDGLRAAGEAEMLTAVEEGIIDLLVGRCEAVFVGHVISEGSLHIVCYAPSVAIETDAALLEGFDPGGYEVAWFVEEEPDWDFFFEFLYPSDVDYHIIQNGRERAVRAERGDDPTWPRTVHHVAIFEDQRSADAAGAALTGLGYEVDRIAEAKDIWIMQFHREDRLDDDTPDRFCAEIIELAEAYGGIYEGWDAAVVPPTPM